MIGNTWLIFRPPRKSFDVVFGYDGKHGIGTETDGANAVVLMGARLYDPAKGAFCRWTRSSGGRPTLMTT